MKKIIGTKDKPRLSIFRSLKHIYAQIIDDTTGNTIVFVSSLSKEIKENLGKKTKVDQAKIVGDLLAKKTIESGIKKVVFDRGCKKYHGRIKAIAESARSGGLDF